MPKDYFDERLAARYDATSQHMFASGMVDPAVDFLEGPTDGGG